MKYRKLRIAWSVAWGIVAGLLIALWVRSYFTCDEMEWIGSPTAISATSFRGQVGSFDYPTGGLPLEMHGMEFTSRPLGEGDPVEFNDGHPGHPLPSFLGFKASWSSALIRLPGSILVIPYWFPTFVCGLAAAVPWLQYLTWRFSLCTLLIVTTLVAAGLGLIVWASH
jgi:hypothetical protein